MLRRIIGWPRSKSETLLNSVESILVIFDFFEVLCTVRLWSKSHFFQNMHRLVTPKSKTSCGQDFVHFWKIRGSKNHKCWKFSDSTFFLWNEDISKFYQFQSSNANTSLYIHENQFSNISTIASIQSYAIYIILTQLRVTQKVCIFGP